MLTKTLKLAFNFPTIWIARICCLILINGNSAELFLKQWNHMFFHANNQKFYIPHHQHIVYYMYVTIISEQCIEKSEL